MDILSNNLVVTKVNEQTMVRTLPINLDSFTSILEYEYQNLTHLTKKSISLHNILSFTCTKDVQGKEPLIDYKKSHMITLD